MRRDLLPGQKPRKFCSKLYHSHENVIDADCLHQQTCAHTHGGGSKGSALQHHSKIGGGGTAGERKRSGGWGGTCFRGLHLRV